MPSPAPIATAYRRALLLARDHAYAVNRAGVERTYRAFAETLARLAAEDAGGVLTPSRAERLRREIDALLGELQRTLARQTEAAAARVAIDLVEIHRRATEQIARRVAPGVAIAAEWDRVPVRAIQAMLARPNAATFQTLYARSIARAAPEIDTFLEAAVARGVGAGRAAKDLAGIIASRGGVGADVADVRAFERAFRAVDTGTLHVGAGVLDYDALAEAYGLTDADVGALRKLLYDARRIQVTETNTAHRAANDAAMEESPLVLAAQLQLSGRHHVPDICDVLATQDAYGYGPGFYPVGMVPLAIHPHCGCYTGQAIFVRPADWGKPKPPPRPLGIDPRDARHTAPWADRWTEKERERYQQQYVQIIAESESARRQRIAA